jgi:hypothetical protein
MADGDKVVLIYGGKVPYVLRSLAGEQRIVNPDWFKEEESPAFEFKTDNPQELYGFVGECYVHGIMEGQGLGGSQVETRTLHLR